jgi:hypothetical protein
MDSDNLGWDEIKRVEELCSTIRDACSSPKNSFPEYIDNIMRKAIFPHNYFIYDQYTLNPITLKRSSNYYIYKEYHSLFLKYLKQHPAVKQIPQANDGFSGSFRSILSQEVFHDLDLYKEIYCKLGVEDQMWIGWEDDGILNYVAYSRDTPFSAKEMAMLTMVQRDLITAAKKWYATDGKWEALAIKSQDKPAFRLQGIPSHLSGSNLIEKSKLNQSNASRTTYNYDNLADFKYVGIYDLGEDAAYISANDSLQINSRIADLKKEGFLLVSAGEAENNPDDTPIRIIYDLFFNLPNKPTRYVGFTSRANNTSNFYYNVPTTEDIEPPDDSSQHPFYKSFNTALNKLCPNGTVITQLCGEGVQKLEELEQETIVIQLCDKSHSVQVREYVPVEFNSIKQYAVFKAILQLSDQEYEEPVNLQEFANRAGKIEQQLTPQTDQEKNGWQSISSSEDVSKILYDLREYYKSNSRLAFLKPLILQPRQSRLDLANYEIDFDASLSGARKISQY